MVAEGGKPPPGGSKPPSSNPALNGAGKGATPAAASGSGFALWLQQLRGQHGKAVQSAAESVRLRMASTKFSMPVDVKVDFLRPTVEAVKESITTVWVQLPPPVQQAVPYVGVAVGSGALVFMLQQRRINHANRRGDELNQQVKNLAKEKEELMKRINLLKAKSGTPRTEVEARMASAVAEATNAAAAAADAAARAATACIFQRMPQVPLPPSPQELPKGQGPFLQ